MAGRPDTADGPLFPRPDPAVQTPVEFGCSVLHGVVVSRIGGVVQPRDLADVVQDACLHLLQNEAFLDRCARGLIEEVSAIARKAGRNACARFFRDRARHVLAPLDETVLSIAAPARPPPLDLRDLGGGVPAPGA